MRYLAFFLVVACNSGPAPQPVAATAATTSTPTASATPEPTAPASATATATATTSATDRATCERELSALARMTDAAYDPNGTSEVRPPAKPGDRWSAFYLRSHGSSDIELDPKTGELFWGSTGGDKSPLRISPALRPHADAARASCH